MSNLSGVSLRRPVPCACAMLAALGLFAEAAQAQLQRLPSAPESFVSIDGTGCLGATLRGQTELNVICPTPPAASADAGASNYNGLLRAGSGAGGVDGWGATATGRAAWRDEIRILGGPLPATALFTFEMRGTISVTVLQGGGFGSNEASLHAGLQPLGGWGTTGAFATGNLQVRQDRAVAGQTSSFEWLVLRLPVSTAGLQLGQGFTVDTDLQVRSQGGGSLGQGANALAGFQDTAGISGLSFFDASGSDITAQVQWQWTYGTQFLPPVPEPGTGALWLAGVGTLGWLVRRRALVQCSTLCSA